DVFSGAPDDVLLPVDEGEHAVRVTPHDVARVEPAAAPRLFRRLGVLEVAGKEAMPWPLGPAPAHEQLAFDVRRDFLVLVVDDFRLEAAERPPERARRHLPRLVTVAVGPSRLRHSPDFDERKPEAF